MWFLLIPLAALIGWAIANWNDVEVSDKSDCSVEFLAFDQNLSIIPSKKKQLDTARKVLQDKIKEYFSAKTTTPSPTFYIQGSHKHGTIIRKQDDTCDVDVGIYFQKEPDILPLAIHNNIVSAFKVHTNEKPTIKNKCVRIYYSNQFHIDLPVYCIKAGQYFIGVGDNGWKPDDPKLFTEWFERETSGNAQKIRLIKYFKSWADYTKSRLKQKMPSGLALTIWVIKYFEGDKREDLAFLKTGISLRNYLKDESTSNWECKMPTIPGDSVIEKLNKEQRENFLSALNNLIETSVKIVALTSKAECIAKWKSIFGKWF